METFTKSIEIEVPIHKTAPSRSLLRFLARARRVGPVVGFAAGFVGVLLFIHISGLSAVVAGEGFSMSRAYPNPVPNAALSADAQDTGMHPIPPPFPNPGHTD